MPIVDQIASALGGNIADGVAKIISLFKIDPNIALQKQVELQEIQLGMARDAAAQAAAQIQGQLDTNKAEASNTNWFVSSWRPSVGWCCSLGLFTQFIIAPFATWAANLAGHPIVFPTLDMGTLMTLLLGMLGLGGMRSYEKINGVNAGH
jgi:hypothetical protein